MSYTGHEDHSISLHAAAELTERYREQMGDNDKKGGYFGKDAIISILNQSGCVGIRYYYGLDEESVQVMVLVGVDSNGNDLVNGDLAEMSLPCPEYCSSNNDLNS